MQSSLYIHFNDEETGGSERLNNLSKFRNPYSARGEFCLSDLKTSVFPVHHIARVNRRHMNVSLPSLVLGVPEDDATGTSRPGMKKTQLRQRIKCEKISPKVKKTYYRDDFTSLVFIY